MSKILIYLKYHIPIIIILLVIESISFFLLPPIIGKIIFFVFFISGIVAFIVGAFHKMSRTNAIGTWNLVKFESDTFEKLAISYGIILSMIPFILLYIGVIDL